jgi:hypothetical protein
MGENAIQARHFLFDSSRKVLAPSVLFSFLIAVIVFYCVPHSMADLDIWWHLRNAQIQLATHSFIRHDVFSYTASGASWMDHEWLAELPFYAGYVFWGTKGLYVVTLLTIEFIFLGIFYLTYSLSDALSVSAFTTVLGILLSTVSFGPRTLLFGWVLLVIELVVLRYSAKHPWLIWTLPGVFAVWVNTHGSWLIGIVILSLFVVTCRIGVTKGFVENRAIHSHYFSDLATSWALSVVALFINPYGWRLVLYPFDLALRQKLNIGNIEEWKSLDFHSPRGRILFLSLAVLFLFQLLRSRKWSLFELGTTLIGTYSAVTYSRFLFLAAILMMPSLATSLAIRPTAPRKALTPLVSAALIFVILSFVVGQLRIQEPHATESDFRFPNNALPFLSTFHPQGRVFNDYLWGGFLIWHNRDVPVFIDSRVDIFEYNGTFKDYLDIVRLNGSLAILDKYKIRYVLFERNAPLTYLLKATGLWKVDYEDDTTTLLERLSPGGRTIDSR